MSRNIWKRIDWKNSGYGGEIVEYVDISEMEEGGDYLNYSGEPSDRYGWARTAWAEFAQEEDLPLDLWDEVFDILRSHLGRLVDHFPIKACYSEETISTAEDFLARLYLHSSWPVLEIPTGLDRPWAVGYVLHPQEVGDFWLTIRHGRIVPTESVLALDTAIEYMNEQSEGYKETDHV